MRIRRRRDELERRLGSERPQGARRVRLAARRGVTPAPIRRRSGWSVALAASLTTLLTVALALTGGIGYAAGAAKDGTTAVTALVSSSDNPGKSDESSGKSDDSSGRQLRDVGRRAPDDNSAKSDEGSANSTLRELGRQLRELGRQLRSDNSRRDRAHRLITSKPYAMSHPETRTTPTRSSWTTAQCPPIWITATHSGRAPRSPGLLTTSTRRKC